MRGRSFISGNRAGIGGGVLDLQTVTMRDSSAIARNAADGNGGGVANFGTLRMRDSTRITDNQAALLGSGYDGGGVWGFEGSALDGVRCANDGPANDYANTPDDCWPSPP